MQFLFGINPYMSLGPFAVISLMTGNALLSCAQLLNGAAELTAGDSNPWVIYELIIPLSEILTLSVGILLLIIFILDLGPYFDPFLPDTLIMGFTSAASVAIVTSQLKGLLGISVLPVTGTYIIAKSLAGIFAALKNTNWLAIVISASTILIIIFFEFVEKLVLKHQRTIKAWIMKSSNESSPIMTLNIPKVLIAIIIMSSFTYAFEWNREFKISIIGTINSGLPDANIPWRVFNMIESDQYVQLITSLLPNVLSIVLVAYCTMKSIIQTFPSEKRHTENELQLDPSNVAAYESPAEVKADDAPIGDYLEPESHAATVAANQTAKPKSFIEIDHNCLEITEPNPVRPRDDQEISVHILRLGSIQNENHSNVSSAASMIPDSRPKPEPYWKEEKNELLALSMSNVLCSFLSGYVSSGSLSRSAILATQTQAKSPMANTFSSFFILISVMFLSRGLYYIPMACLSTVVIYALKSTVLKISDGYSLFKHAKNENIFEEWRMFINWFVTFICVIVWDPSTGIIAGVAVNQAIRFGLYVKGKFFTS